MLDITDKLEVFIITNGRATYPFCQQYVDQQKDVKFKTTVHRDMEWLEANQKIIEVCKSPFFLRVDDDMILHPRAVSYMWRCVENQYGRIALRGWRLWEPYSHKICKGIKIYNKKVVQKMGGFRISNLGKIDKVFTRDAKARGFKIKYGEDIVAIHACSSPEEHIKYSVMRGEDKGPNWKQERKWIKKHVSSCNLSIEEQSKLTGKFLYTLNRKRNNPFYKFIK